MCLMVYEAGFYLFSFVFSVVLSVFHMFICCYREVTALFTSDLKKKIMFFLYLGVLRLDTGTYKGFKRNEMIFFSFFWRV